MANTKVLSDTTRRWLRTSLQVFILVAGAIPGIVEIFKALGADLFGLDSVAYGRILAVTGSIALVFSALLRAYLALEAKFPALELIRKTNSDPAVAVVEVQGGQIVETKIVAEEDVPGDHSIEAKEARESGNSL